MKHQAVFLDFRRKSVTYVGVAEAAKKLARLKPAQLSAEPVTPRSKPDDPKG